VWISWTNKGLNTINMHCATMKFIIDHFWFLSYFNDYFPLYTPHSWSGSNIYIFLFSKMFIPALGPTEPPFQSLLQILSFGLKRPELGTNISPSSNAEDKNESIYYCILRICFCGMDPLKKQDWRLCTGFICLSIPAEGCRVLSFCI